MKPEDDAKAEVFRASVWSLLWFEWPGGFLVFMGLLFLFEGTHFHKGDVVLGFLLCLPFAWFVSWFISRFFPDIIAADGIQGHSFWGLKRFIRWQDIREARPFQLFNLRFLRLYSKQDQSVTWIGLFPARRADFVSTIQRFAPADCPLLQFIA